MNNFYKKRKNFSDFFEDLGLRHGFSKLLKNDEINNYHRQL